MSLSRQGHGHGQGRVLGGEQGELDDDPTQTRKRGSSPSTPSRSNRFYSSSSFRRPSSPLQPLSDSTSNSIGLSPSSIASTSALASSSIPGPSSNYSFPPHHSPGTSPTSMTTTTTATATSTAQHRMSLSRARSRRPSPLLHEIQPPSRRLSAHQMLLLTPFGGVVPPGTLGAPLGGTGTVATTGAGVGVGMSSTATAMGAGMGMQRVSSSMGRSSPVPAPRGSVTMSVGPSTMGAIGATPPTGRDHLSHHLPSRTLRHHSLAANPTYPSPLTATPMTTIPSASDAESSSSGHPSSVAPSRETSNNVDELPHLVGGTPGTVPMTRSNSLPVLTLRELSAMKEKDGELGIARGGGWAWVSRESDDEDEDDGGLTPMLDNTNTTASSTSLSSATSNRTDASAYTTPPGVRNSLFPFTAFNDPFAAPSTSASSLAGGLGPATTSASAGMSRDSGPSSHGPFVPIATIPGYHYSPTYNDTRRMSDALAFQHPSGGSSTSAHRASQSSHPSPGSTIGRRPSAPLATIPARHSTAGIGTTPPKERERERDSYRSSDPYSIGQSPGGTTTTVSPSRPKITRYKSLPGRSQGLGLSIVVRPQPYTGPPTMESRRDSEESTGGAGASTSTGAAATGGGGGRRRRSNKGRVSGNWAAIDVVDSLAATDLNSSNSISPLSSTRGSLHSSESPSGGSRGLNRPPAASELLYVEEISSRAHLSEFGQKPLISPGGTGRSRFESIDSALPLVGVHRGPGGNGYMAALAQGGWNATFPRRGSLAVLSKSALSSWVAPPLTAGVGGGGGGRGGSDGDIGKGKDKVGLNPVGGGLGLRGHWSERRGSWAEGWMQKEYQIRK